MRGLVPVAGSYGSLLTGLIPLGLVVAVSPLTVIPAVLVLHAPRPRPTGLAFLGGWLFGLAALTALFVAGSGVLGQFHKSSPPTWASWLRVVLGTALIVFGIYQWLTRHGHTESPKWMRSFETISPRRAAITGLVLVVIRVEVLLMCLAAGLAIGTSQLMVSKTLNVVFFVVVSASTVAIPILAYAAAGERLDEPLARLKDWMEKNNAALLAVILLLIGALVLHNGIHGLTA